MQQLRFKAQKRNVFGKGAGRALRRNGLIPAVLYGRHQDVIPLELDAQAFQRFLHSNGENVLIDLEIGDHDHEAIMIKEIQRDPVEHSLIHADFIRISMEEPVTSFVPITLIGTPPGIQEGGVLEFTHRELHLRALPMLLPNDVEVDTSGLDIDDFIRVEDVPLAEGIELLDDPQTMITLVSRPKVEAEPTPEEEAEEAVEGEVAIEEPEVISRKRDEDEEE